MVIHTMIFIQNINDDHGSTVKSLPLCSQPLTMHDPHAPNWVWTRDSLWYTLVSWSSRMDFSYHRCLKEVDPPLRQALLVFSLVTSVSLFTYEEDSNQLRKNLHQACWKRVLTYTDARIAGVIRCASSPNGLQENSTCSTSLQGKL